MRFDNRHGDHLEILRSKVDDESIGLIYVDIPIALTQITIDEVAETAPENTTATLDIFHAYLGESDLMSYLVYMSVLLTELHRILKPTGSFYLHCDPTASHYLKIILDQTFGLKNFRNEIIWSYGRSPSKQKNFQRTHDTIFRYSKSGEFTWHQLFEPLSASTLKSNGGEKVVSVFDKTTGKRVRAQRTGEKSPGAPMRDVWVLSEQLLLKRIVKASSNEGDLILTLQKNKELLTEQGGKNKNAIKANR